MRIEKFFFISGFIIAFLIISNSCKKDPVTPNVPTTPATPTTPSAPVFTVDNKWECQIDGINYSGTIDTSFYQIINPEESNPDTVVDCSGTSNNKNASIHFRIIINRTLRPAPISTVSSNGLLVFDTASTKYLIASSNFNGSNVTYNIDTLVSNKLKATFSGQLMLPPDGTLHGGSIHTISNGKFSCAFGTGNGEPNNFSFNSNTSQISGYFLSASLTSNTLVMDGLPYTYYGEQKFKLLIRTGGTIKTGIYKSKNGDVGLQLYSPSIYPFYVNDTLGDLTVIINSVKGNIVDGFFSGINGDGKAITGGNFSCRVKNYVPQVDSSNKWGFSVDESIFLYNIYGGNVLNASKSQILNKYFLTVNGESDNGDSKFKVVISSYSPISTGTYQTGYFSNHLDTLYFKSNRKIWNGNTTYFYSDGHYPTYCRIDTINSYKVVGTLFGKINIYLSSSGFTSTDIKKGSFRASF